MAKKIAPTLIFVFLVFYLVSQPTEAAAGARELMSGAGWVFDGIRTFLRNLA